MFKEKEETKTVFQVKALHEILKFRDSGKGVHHVFQVQWFYL